MLAKHKGYMLSTKLYKKVTDADNVDPQQVWSRAMNTSRQLQKQGTKSASGDSS
jgi:hypothetical protein